MSPPKRSLQRKKANGAASENKSRAVGIQRSFSLRLLAWYDAHAARWSGLAADLEREAAARTPASADSVEWPAAGGP